MRHEDRGSQIPHEVVPGRATWDGPPPSPTRGPRFSFSDCCLLSPHSCFCERGCVGVYSGAPCRESPAFHLRTTACLLASRPRRRRARTAACQAAMADDRWDMNHGEFEPRHHRREADSSYRQDEDRGRRRDDEERRKRRREDDERRDRDRDRDHDRDRKRERRERGESPRHGHDEHRQGDRERHDDSRSRREDHRLVEQGRERQAEPPQEPHSLADVDWSALRYACRLFVPIVVSHVVQRSAFALP